MIDLRPFLQVTNELAVSASIWPILSPQDKVIGFLRPPCVTGYVNRPFDAREKDIDIRGGFLVYLRYIKGAGCLGMQG